MFTVRKIRVSGYLAAPGFPKYTARPPFCLLDFRPELAIFAKEIRQVLPESGGGGSDGVLPVSRHTTCNPACPDLPALHYHSPLPINRPETNIPLWRRNPRSGPRSLPRAAWTALSARPSCGRRTGAGDVIQRTVRAAGTAPSLHAGR